MEFFQNFFGAEKSDLKSLKSSQFKICALNGSSLAAGEAQLHILDGPHSQEVNVAACKKFGICARQLIFTGLDIHHFLVVLFVFLIYGREQVERLFSCLAFVSFTGNLPFMHNIQYMVENTGSCCRLIMEKESKQLKRPCVTC